METQKRFSIQSYWVVLFAFGLLFSCEQLVPVEAPVQVAEEFMDMSGFALEPEEDPIYARLVYSSDCESDCIEPGSGNYFAIRDSKSQSSGINTKKVSYKAYNTEDKFVVKVKYEVSSGPSQAKASISIQINGKKKEFKSVPSGYTATFSIPLEKGWDKCDEVTFSIIQKGLGTPISFSEDYDLIPVCEIGDTFSDPRDGQVYKIVRIGDQVWFAENLKYASGDCYDNQPENCEKYGYLYGIFNAPECPNGWHVPNNSEWEELIDFLGGSEVAGGKMKSISGWNEPNIGATNESGFNAIPGGYLVWTVCCGSPESSGLGEYGKWWSQDHYHVSINNGGSNTSFYRWFDDEGETQYAVSCRCIKD